MTTTTSRTASPWHTPEAAVSGYLLVAYIVAAGVALSRDLDAIGWLSWVGAVAALVGAVFFAHRATVVTRRNDR
jgi:hypothetical protein